MRLLSLFSQLFCIKSCTAILMTKRTVRDIRLEMDPLTAFGLASNVAQFVSFACDLVSMSKEIYSSSEDATGDVLTLEGIHDQLIELGAGLDASSKSDLNAETPVEITVHLTKIKGMSDSCKKDSDTISTLVEKLKVKSGPGRKWRSFSVALLTIWKKDELSRLLKRLRQAQASITTELCGMAK